MTALPAADTFVIPTRLFGPLEVARHALIHFPDGLLGFGGERAFALLGAETEGLYWLQDAHDSSLAFLLADPYRFLPGYAPELPAHLAPEFESATDDQLSLLVIVTLPPRRGEAPTANVRAPLLIDLAARRGRQVVLEDAALETRRPFPLVLPA